MGINVTKAVIPVAGLGTRMLPATKAIPKEMLPVVDKPLIQHVVSEIIAAGIREIVLVTHASKNSIENHFDTSFELEATLERRVKRQLLHEVQSICPPDVSVISVRQHEPKGLGHAILCARPVVGEVPFAVVLPDVLLDDHASDPSKDNLAAMVREYERSSVSQIMVEQVPEHLVSNYGIVDIDSREIGPGEHAPIKRVVEKPKSSEAPSDLAVVGRYVLPPSIWSLLADTKEGAGGEIQLTDAIDELLTQESIAAFAMTGKSYDCGSKFGYMKANFEYALRHKELGEPMLQYLKQRLNSL